MMKRDGFFFELLHFLLHEKKWWMIPLFIILGLIALFILAFESPVAPFLYPLF